MGRGRGRRCRGPYGLSDNHQKARARAAIATLAGDDRVITAARIARTFRLDPIDLLRDGGDEFLTWVRIAASEVVARDEEAAAKKAKKK